MRAGAHELRFTNLSVKNWRNFLKADVKLGNWVFLAGPSAAGKSNLLDVFRFLHDICSPGGGFQEAVRQRGGVRKLRCLAARQDSDLALLVQAGTDLAPAEWEYELHFNQDGRPRPFVKRERLSHGGEEVFARPDEQDEADPERLFQTLLEQGGLHQQVRPFAAFLATVRYLHLVPQLMRAPDRAAGPRYDPLGGDILERIAATPEKSQVARLRLILDALRAAAPQLMELEANRDKHGRPHLRARYEHWRPRGAWHTEEQLSDGTLRLIGLLWAVLDGNGPLLIEEPEISLHAEVVRLVPRMLARLARRTGRQTMLTTHSLDLLCGEGVETDEILLLNPRAEGAHVRSALDLKEAADLLDRGALPPEPPSEAPEDTQMPLFGESVEPE